MTDALLTVAVEPVADPEAVAAVEASGGVVTHLARARVLVWLGTPGEFPALPDTVEYVALKTAGIEGFTAAGVIDDRRLWTNASGFYAEGVAEHALGLLLAGLRQIAASVRAGRWAAELDPRVTTLRGSTVAIVGAGGIGRALVPRLKACGARVLAVNHSGREVPGADQVLTHDRLDEVWAATDHVVLAAPVTAQTRHLVNARVLTALPRHCWIVNVGRGPLIDQAALVDAVEAGEIAGAALDVTDPEPPADDDPIFSSERIIVTPHIANPSSGLTREMAPFLTENLRRFTAGEELIARIHAGRDY
ncbi:NAD(P)-dependent oxidoreductase [Gordonia sp. VNK21]|uniref:NAD(P)-dependent oxidoreductase n=1 Tax=Gordonia sp. VNK21 TaxID=3382483 RepID=UPI0038D4AA30